MGWHEVAGLIPSIFLEAIANINILPKALAIMINKKEDKGSPLMKAPFGREVCNCNTIDQHKEVYWGDTFSYKRNLVLNKAKIPQNI